MNMVSLSIYLILLFLFAMFYIVQCTGLTYIVLPLSLQPHNFFKAQYENKYNNVWIYWENCKLYHK